MWIGMDFNEFYGHHEIDKEKSERWKDNNPLTSIYDPAPEHLRKYYDTEVRNQRYHTKIKSPMIMDITWFTDWVQ